MPDQLPQVYPQSEKALISDPTVLTTAALQREVSILERRITELREAFDEKLELRLDGFQKIADLQFRLIADWRLEQKDDTKVSVDAALAAQEKAIIKQEASTARQIEQLSETFDTAIGELRRGNDELKARVGAMESLRLGNQEQRIEARAMSGATMAMIGLLITIVLATITVAGVLVGAQ